MKKRDRSLSKSYSPLKLYLDHLEEIQEILKENEQSISIATKDYVYDSIEELQSNIREERISELDINAKPAYVRIEFARMSASLSVLSGDTSNTGVFYKLDQVISTSTRTPRLFYNGWFIYVMASVLWPFIVLILALELSRPYLLILAALAVLMTSWLLWAMSVLLRRHSVIALIYKSSETSFFKRNKDNLILAAISAILGGVLGVAGTILISRLQNK